MKITYFILFSFLLFSVSCEKDANGLSSENSGNTGKAGSMSKFTFNGDYLYVVSGSTLNVYDVKNSGDPKIINTVTLNNNGIETIFCNSTNLFFGTQFGLLIYGLSDPIHPNYISTYSHVVSCDPVVVSGNLAFVTLSGGTICNRGLNQLEVIDISNLSSPKLLKVYPFNNPKGMALNGNYMYLCDATSGLYVLDISDHMNIQVVSEIPNIPAFDAIKNGNVLTITGKDGVFQYDCSDPVNLVFLSKL